MIITLKTADGKTLFEAHIWHVILRMMLQGDPAISPPWDAELYANGRKIEEPESFEDDRA